MPKKELVRKTLIYSLPSITLSAIGYLFIILGVYVFIGQPIGEAESIIAENSTEWISDNYNSIVEQSVDKSSPILAAILGFIGYSIHRIGKIYTKVMFENKSSNRRKGL
jgi:hypothetical protein